MLSTMAVFSACSDDDDDKGGVDLAQEIKGDYFGALDVTVSEDVAEPTSNIINATAIAKNEIQLDLKEFTYIEGGIGIKIRDIKLEKIKLKGKEGDIELTENTQTIKISVGGAPIDAKVKTNGTVKGKKMSLVLDIDAAGLDIEVKFNGDLLGDVASTLYDMEEEWGLEVDQEGGEVYGYLPGPKGYWGSSNIGAIFLSGFTKKGLCVTQSEESRNGKYAVRIETLDSKGGNMFGQTIPKVTSGSLFLGKFDLGQLEHGTLECTQFGIPFDKKPLSLSAYYKYTSGGVFYRVPEGGTIDKPETAPEGTKDKCSINAVLYEISSDDDAYITGKDTYSDPRIVAKAMFTSGDTDGYKLFSVNFDYVEGKTYDKSKKYRFAIIASSSAEGNSFSGAPDSVLYLDDIEVTYEK